MKKILYGVWVWSIAVLLLLNMSTSAQAAEIVSQGTCGASVYWTLDSDGLLTISGSGEMDDYLETARPWGNQIRRVTVEEGVQSIGPGAFYGCQLLESVSLPETVTKIGSSAFFYCESLEQISLPSELTHIGDGAFYGCEKLKSIRLPEGVTALGKRCFYRCRGLETAELPDSLAVIGEETFADCEKLTTVKFPKGLQQMESCAFLDCAALAWAELPEGVVSIGASAFEGCVSLTGVSMPEELTTLGAGAFRGCESLEKIVVPEGIVTLERFVFAGCYSLKSVSLPQTLSHIDRYAFNACKSLESVSIPRSVIQIGEGAFAACNSMKSLEIPEGVTRLEMWFASNCDALESVSLPTTLTQIGDYAFQCCPALKQILLPEGLASIGGHAFRECDSLERLDIPDSVTDIGEYVFFECDSLKNVRLPQAITAIPAGMFEGCVSLEQIDIPKTVTGIGHSAFVECESLESVTVPEGVDRIGAYTFYGCIRLKQVTLPETLTRIDECAFAECESLGQLALPESVTYVGYETFRNCLSLEEMILPEGMPYVSTGLFYNCINLRQVRLPGSIGSIGEAAFFNCINLKEAELPKGVTYIAKDAFLFCTGLKNLVLPEKLTYVGDTAFACCNALEWVELPAAVQNLEMGAFYACTGLRKVFYRGTWKQWQGIAVGTNNECLLEAERSYLHDGIVYRYDGERGTLYLPQAAEIPDNFMQDASWDGLRDQIFRIVFSADAARIGENAFSNLPQLGGIWLGSQVTDIHPDAFRNCPKLVIHGQAESYAQSFAQTNGIGFSTEHRLTLLISRAASCEEDGYELRGCDLCGWEERVITQEKLGHTPLPILGETPLCMRVGLTEGSGCGTCGKILQEQSVLPMDPDSHHYEGIRTEPTCTEDGYTVFTCVLCGHSYVGNQVAASHRYVSAVTNPTCTEAGFTTYTCHCGDSYTDNIYPAQGHREHSDILIGATCTQSGLIGQTVCTVCGAVLSQQQQIPPTGHAWDTGTVAQEPTEDTQGVRLYTCSVCQETKTESIPVLAHSHSYRRKVTAPGCTEEGYTTYSCSCGDSYTADRVAALGHDVILDEAEPPTCGWFGLTEGSYCGRCGIVLVEQQIIPPTDHSWGQWVETVAPDATNDGVRTRMCTQCGETEEEQVDNNIFSDVKADRFEEAILWAYYNGITTGTGDGTTFSPENTCTRKQIVTFLWRAAGEPEPKSMVNPFTDVKSDRFEKAILWAFYEGITTGTGDGTTFSPENTCTRKQIVTFLWRYHDEPAPESMEIKFTDVKNDRFAAAILWAAEQGITTGTGDGTTFSPEAPCTRKQIVTFLYRDLAE